MSDYRRPVDELPVKDESTLSLTDTLIGVDAVAEPAAFQAQLGEIAARLVGPIADGLPSDAGFVDELIPLIIGQVETDADGSYVRLENGLQVCWKNHQIPASVAVNVANSGWGYRSGQQDAPFPAAFVENVRTFAVANINTVGYFATSGASSAASFTFHFVSGASVTVPSGAFVNLLAIGRWK